MEKPPVTNASGQGAGGCAADKIAAAFALLTAAFADSRLDADTLSKADLIDQVVATQRVVNTAWAVQSARLAQAGAIEEVCTPDAADPAGFHVREVRHPIGAFRAEFIGSEVAPALGWTTGAAQARVSEASDAITRTPRLFARVGTGELDPAKLATMHRALGQVVQDTLADRTRATLDLARDLETVLLGDPDTADSPAEAAAVEQGNVNLLARQSTAQVRHRVARVLATVDPVAADRAATRRRRDRVGVFTRPDDEPGLCRLQAVLPAVTAANVMAAVDAHARELRADTTTDKTLAECRADALADLVLDNATITTHLIVQVPVHHTRSTTHTSSGPADGRAVAGAGAFGAGTAGGRWFGFAHPVTGSTVFPDRWQQPASAIPGSTAAGDTPAGSMSSGETSTEGVAALAGDIVTGTGVVVASQDVLDREFNELIKRQYRPDPDDGNLDEWDPDDDGGLEAECDSRSEGRPPPRRSWLSPPDPGQPAGRGGSSRPDGVCAAWLGDAVVPGVGIIPAAVVEAMSRSFGVTMTRALIDADTGVTVATCETTYRPSPKLVRFVQARDVHCRFPGCTRAARWCDVDHVTPWPHGATTAGNLQCLCRHHHRTKQAHGWSVTMTPQGVCTWTSPTGRTYTTTPAE